ncbi:General substrate transporter family and Major facilitator superfamily domain, general substrate transporter and Major facilitator superfamily domain-containing protein [Strongyloides ratti]|uniref:General substrate transporter family and Major facilitator superfamily domain, general substrate transporter and Major facilitator superfamily domain-containing protein n=1 Tax=Strongyloides ratti TaxID=34506 RepID=A0A090LPA3_STRRB|nr:General substrate transporter family and Major facilitator superfamily domain, general substrate transporter and Major facilitator superfamily domain-containing protein [Strongyloides ratti]CEF71660.1 General substrate transporter family and Major facilitator superfamily domain, general substrate transporter and Major facilitator superfamily domain-containing protein [Strongyloides ratti]
MSDTSSETKSINVIDDKGEENTTYDKLSWTRTLFLILVSIILTTLTNLPSGSSHTTINTGATLIDEYMNDSYTSRGNDLSPGQISLLRSGLSSSWYVGQIIGTIIAPIIMNKLGRKPAYLISIFCMTAACTLQWLSTHLPYPEIFFAGRIIGAVFSPLADAALIIYTREIAPPSLAGALGSMMNPGFSACALVGALLSTKHILGDSLKKMLFVPIMPGIIGMLFLFWIPETPKFLYLSQNNEKKARKALKFYMGKETNVDGIIERYEIEKLQEMNKESGKFTDIFFISHVRKATLLCLTVFMLTLPFYPFLSYSTHFLDKLNFDHSISQYLSTIVMILLTVTAIVSPAAINKFSRRGMTLGVGIFGYICITLFSICGFFNYINEYMKYFSFTFMIGYMVSHGLAIGSIAWFIGTELVSHEYSSIVLCFCIGIQSFMIAATNFATMPFYDLFGPLSLIPLFVIPSIIFFAIVYYHLPETKDAPIADVILQLKNGIRGKTNIFPLTVPLILGENLVKKAEAVGGEIRPATPIEMESAATSTVTSTTSSILPIGCDVV